MTYYNDTNISSANNIFELALAVNQSSGNIFYPVIMVAIFFIVAVVYRNMDFKALFLMDSFFMVILALLGFFLGLATWVVLIVSILLLFFSLMAYIFG